MTRTSKKPEKRRLLLDEDELKPKTADPWDFFYGKTRSAGAQEEVSDAASLPRIPVDAPLDAPAEPPSKTYKRKDRAKGRIPSARIEPHRKQFTPRVVSNKTVKRQRIPVASRLPVDFTFEDFERVFSKRLAKADMRVCRVVFDETTAVRRKLHIFKIEELAAQVGISRRHIYRVLGGLENAGFIKRGNIYNTPTTKGVELTFHPYPDSELKKQNAAPRLRHFYDKKRS